MGIKFSQVANWFFIYFQVHESGQNKKKINEMQETESIVFFLYWFWILLD